MALKKHMCLVLSMPEGSHQLPDSKGDMHMPEGKGSWTAGCKGAQSHQAQNGARQGWPCALAHRRLAEVAAEALASTKSGSQARLLMKLCLL